MPDHLKRILNPLHVLTKRDIALCVSTWQEKNRSPFLFLSPYRWARIASDGMPTSIYQLNDLVNRWGQFDANDALGDEDARTVAQIIVDRVSRGSHSAQDYYGNSSKLFQALVQRREIVKHLPIVDLPKEPRSLCDELERLLQDQYSSCLSSSQYSTALDYINKVRTLAKERHTAAEMLARGFAYYGSNGVLFYVPEHRGLTYAQALSIVDQFLATVVDAAQTCGKLFALHTFFNEMGSPFAVCMVGKSASIFRLGINLKNSVAANFESENKLMEAVFQELNLFEEPDQNKFEEKILERFGDQTFSGIKLTKELVHDYLHKYILQPPEAKSSMRK